MHLSKWQQWRVVDEDGMELGHLFDLRCTGLPLDKRPREYARVNTLVYGTVGWLERLGLRAAREAEARWQDVVALRDGALIVRVGRSRKRSR
jgi:hypothetical protein